MEQTEIAIVGAGIAGLSLAYHLAENYPHKQIALIEQKSLLELSNHTHCAVVIEPAFVVGSNDHQSFNQKAYFAALEFYQNFDSDIFHSQGLIKLANAKHLEKKQTKLIQMIELNHQVASEFVYLSGNELSNLAEVSILKSGIYYPNAQLLNPYKITKAIIQKTQSIIDYFFGQSISEIKPTKKFWKLINIQGEEFIRAKKVIYAGGFDGLKLLNSIQPNLKKSFSKTRGQISIINIAQTNYQPKITISGDGFVSSVLQVSEQINHHHICFGSSWDRDFNHPHEIKTEDHQQNLIKANNLVNQPLANLNTNGMKNLNASVSVRLNATNRLPVAYEVNKNFWLFTAFGSRGYQYAPFLSEELIKSLVK